MRVFQGPLLVILLYALATAGLPVHHRTKHKLRYIRNGGSNIHKKRPFFHPRPSFKTFPRRHVFVAASYNPNESPTEFGYRSALSQLGLQRSQLNVTFSFTDSANVTHIYLKHIVHNTEVSNHHAAIHVRDGRVIAFSASFGAPSKLEKRHQGVHPPVATVPESTAIYIAQDYFGLPHHQKHRVKFKYVEIPSGDLVYAYVIQLKDANSWIQVHVDALHGQIVQVVDFVSSASYKVVPFQKTNPTKDVSVIKDPAIHKASPKGWHQSTKSFTVTQGNNAKVYSVVRPGGRRYFADGGESLDFIKNIDFSKAPTEGSNKDAAIINLFYVVNMMHDLTTEYGFDEAAGNFQDVNYGSKGLGNDGVIARAQETSVYNTANFATSPDGQPGEMNMYLFDLAHPIRDGAMENDIPIHEYQHGISNRLTGGAGNAECLEDDISAGLDEGWSDAIAVFINRQKHHTRHDPVIIGEFVANGEGIRSRPFSTDLKVNELTYSAVNNRSESHAMGEIWTSMFFEVFWNLVDSHGFSSNLFDAKQKEGNIVAIQLLIAGLSLQPCQPDFISARDAVLLADTTYYNSIHKCEIWKGFAKRGLGEKASLEAPYEDNFDVPKECK